jgi:hypothetical protein
MVGQGQSGISRSMPRLNRERLRQKGMTAFVTDSLIERIDAMELTPQEIDEIMATLDEIEHTRTEDLQRFVISDECFILHRQNFHFMVLVVNGTLVLTNVTRNSGRV